MPEQKDYSFSMGRGRRQSLLDENIRQTINGYSQDEWLGRDRLKDPVEDEGFVGERAALEKLQEYGVEIRDLQAFMPAEPGLRAEICLRHVGTDIIQIRALFADDQNRVRAHMVRSIELGSGTVFHNSFKVNDPQDQNKGLGLRTFLAHLPLYKKLGLEKIDLYANSEVGGYFWARVGFRVSSPEAGDSVRYRIEEELQHLRSLRFALQSEEDESLDETVSDLHLNESFLESIDGPEGLDLRLLSRYRPRVRLRGNIPPDLRADLQTLNGDPESPRSGKSLLLGSGWNGTFDLHDQGALREYLQGRTGST